MKLAMDITNNVYRRSKLEDDRLLQEDLACSVADWLNLSLREFVILVGFETMEFVNNQIDIDIFFGHEQFDSTKRFF